MKEQDHNPQELVLTYYILESQEVARVSSDPILGDDLGGEILVGDRRWEDYPVSAIIGEGELISRSEAKKCAKKLGLRL